MDPEPRQKHWSAWKPEFTADAGLGIAVACAYLVAAWLGFVLGEARGLRGVWPAAGIAAGVLIALGPRARLPVALAVVAATFLASLLIGRPAWLALALGLCNAGEVLLVAGLVERWCGHPFRLGKWRALWGFLAAVALSSAVAAVAAAAALQLLPGSAPFTEIWRTWAAANGLGIVLVAPVLVGLYQLRAEPITKRELIEGSLALALLAATATLTHTAPPGSLLAEAPPGSSFPFLLWVAARCRPVFAAMAVLIASAALLGATAFQLGNVGARSMALPAMQAMLAIGWLCALSLSALFSERRRSEAALRESNERLRLALDGADLGVWSLDLKTGAFECDERDRRINGHDPAAPPRTLAEARRYVVPEDLVRLDKAFAEARRTGAPCRAEYRVMPRDGARPQPVRWVTMEGSVVSDGAGRPVRLMGVTRDVTERKLAEQALAERTAQLALAGRAGLVGSYAYDAASGTLQISPGFAAIYGLPEDTAEITREDWWRRLHPDDFATLEARLGPIIAARQREIVAEYRIRRPDGEVRWIEQRTVFDYDGHGRLRRAVGVDIDITDRKRNEEHQALLVAELDHRVKNVLAVVSALLSRIGDTGTSASELVAALEGRIKSMAIAHELLSRSKWRGLPLRELIERELEPYAAGASLEIGGPDVVLQAEAGQAMAMVVHELVTNAAKYGALSVERGRVSMRWRLMPENGVGAHLAIDWQETGGPPMPPSSRVGYGTSIIRDLIPYELGGVVDLAFRAEGVCCHLEVPDRWLTTAGRHRDVAGDDSPVPDSGEPDQPNTSLNDGPKQSNPVMAGRQ